MQKYVVTIFAAVGLLIVSAVTHGQSEPNKLNWVQFGNCWVAEPGFLYCGKAHPYAKVSITPFLSFVCHKHYQAVIVGHEPIEEQDTVRVIHSDFGVKEYSSIWVASSATETFMSNNISALNEGYRDLLKGLQNPKSKKLKISITPGDINGNLELTGKEFEAVGDFIAICNDA